MATTGQQVVDDVRALIIEPSPTFFSNARMLSLINLAQREYVRTTRCLEARAFSQCVANQPNYSVPGDYLASLKIFYNNQQPPAPDPLAVDSWLPLSPRSIEKMSQEFPNFPTASIPAGSIQIPVAFYMVEKQIFLFPTPTEAVTNNLLMIYERMPIELNTLADPLSIDDSLVPGVRAYVLWQLYEQDNEDEKAAKWEGRYNMEIGRGRAWKKQRQMDSKVAVDIASFAAPSYGSWTGSGVIGINPLNQ